MQGPPSGKIVHKRYHPSPDIVPYVEHFWSVQWNLEQKFPQKVETLPHPSVHLVFEKCGTALWGVRKGVFSRMLEGQGFVFAVKFRPASFYGFYGTALTAIT